MYLKIIFENYCLEVIRYLLYVYNTKMYYNVRLYENRIELEFYAYDKGYVYVHQIYLNDDYIPSPDTLALKIYNKLIEKEVSE